LRDRFALRACILHYATTEADLAALVEDAAATGARFVRSALTSIGGASQGARFMETNRDRLRRRVRHNLAGIQLAAHAAAAR
jgi:hypothetical protein